MDHKYLHALRSIPGVGSKTLELLVSHFGSAEAAWNAPSFTEVSGITSKSAQMIDGSRKDINPDHAWETLERNDIRVFTKNDSEYPKNLSEIADAPYMLYVRGSYDWTDDRPMIAIVGSRKYTHYGEQVALRLAEDLTNAGILVVSGLAFGIDSIAHKAALEVGGETIAVLGSGIRDEDITPRSHVPLAKKVIERGALVSEFPPGIAVMPGNFPARNRIIAGMTLGTVVIEAAEESGSLITARLALDYNREVFSVPGSIFSPASSGTNKLIKSGAKITTSVQDILEELPFVAIENLKGSGTAIELTPEEEKIFSLLSHEPLHVDKIIKATTLETAAVSSLLTILELKGLIRHIGSMNYIRT